MLYINFCWKCKLNRVASGLQITNWIPPSNFSSNLSFIYWTPPCPVYTLRNFLYWMSSSEWPNRHFKSTKLKNLTSPLFNTRHQWKNLLYRLITHSIFKNTTIDDEFQQEPFPTSLCYTVLILYKRKLMPFHHFNKSIFGIQSSMEVQDEIMEV